MSTSYNIDTANGLFKQRYADNLQFLQPDGVKLLPLIKFNEAEKTGAGYNQAVVLQMEHGLTWGDSSEDAFSLNPPISGTIKQASVQGHPLVLRSFVGVATMTRALNKGPAAFANAMDAIVENMLRSMSKALEIEMLYGQQGYGTVSGSPSGNTITITLAEFASGIWIGGEKMPLEIRSSSGTLRGYCNIETVDIDNRQIVVDSIPAGVVNTDVLYRKGSYGKEFKGIHKILSQSSSDLFGISVTDYSIFKGNSYSAGGADLSFETITKAAAVALSKGQEGKMSLVVNPVTWSNLLSDQAALRKYDSSYDQKIVVNGGENIKFFSQNGEIEIISSIFCKQGYAYLLQLDTFKRVGSSDISFEMPGKPGEYIQALPDAHALELRASSDFALFCFAPGKNVLISSIVNS